jgi:hypothetical protein
MKLNLPVNAALVMLLATVDASATPVTSGNLGGTCR